MLQHLRKSSHIERCLQIDVPAAAQPLLRVLLAEWGYTARSTPEGSLQITPLHSRGQGASPSPTATCQEGCPPLPIAFPVAIPALWSAIETHFHETPRLHIRIPTTCPVTLTTAGRTHDAFMISLSDAGARLLSNREMVRGEMVTIEFCLGDRTYETDCRVIYVISRGEWRSDQNVEIGVAFHWQELLERQAVRDFIVESYLQRIRTVLPEEEFRAGLKHIVR